MSYLGKILIVLGFVFVVVGILFWLSPKIPYLGRLPGDFAIRGRGFTIFIPIATMVLLSVILTLIFNFVMKK